MMTATKSMLALGVLGAMLVGTADAGYARERHVQAPAASVHHKQRYQATDRSGYTLYPREGYGRSEPAYPNVYERPFMSWDPYGMRWDGTD
jgi:hypothetical protein